MAETIYGNGFKMIWRAKEVIEDVNKATIAGMNETMAAAVGVAKGYAPVKSGALRDDIQYQEAYETATSIIGRWGNFFVVYSIYQEYGTVYIEPVYYLRRAMDQEYPKLAERIAAHYAPS